MAPLKIKFITLGLNLKSGGGSNLTLDLMIKFLINRGHQISLITTQESNFSTTTYPVRSEKIYGKFLDVQKRISSLLGEEETDCDLFIAYGPALIWGSSLYKKRGGKIPVISFINNYLPMMNQLNLNENIPFLPKIKKYLFYLKLKTWYQAVGKAQTKHLDFYLFDSPILLEIYKNYGFEEKKLGVLPEFIDTAQTKIEEYKQTTKVVKLLYVGRIIYDKGLDLLIKALANLDKNKIHLDIVGSGQEQKNLEMLAKDLGLSSVISFHPWASQKELIDFYKNNHIFIHPCRWVEPFGRTIVEAMSYGLPIITTEKTGSAWAMGNAGLTFKKEDVEDLRQKIKIMISSQQVLRHYEGLAKKQAASFDYNLVGKGFENKISEIISLQKTKLVTSLD